MNETSALLMFGALTLGALAGHLAAKGANIDLYRRLMACESFLRSIAASQARTVRRQQIEERIAEWRESRRGDGGGLGVPIDEMARKVPDRLRDDAIPR